MCDPAPKIALHCVEFVCLEIGDTVPKVSPGVPASCNVGVLSAPRQYREMSGRQRGKVVRMSHFTPDGRVVQGPAPRHRLNGAFLLFEILSLFPDTA